MYFQPEYTYHIYNRSNETAFKTRENYLFFLEKINKLITPLCDIFAWCIMPNHFHLLISVNAKGASNVGEIHRSETSLLSKNIGTLLSSYTLAINKQYYRRGSLFAHNTKAKQLNFTKHNYAINCFFYIHQNPYTSGLVEKLEDWEYSSFKDYAGFRDGTLCNKELAYEIVNFDKDNFYEQSYIILGENDINKIF
jgi:REP element-mobilizing transposase RayT